MIYFLKYLMFHENTKPIRVSFSLLFGFGFILGIYLNIEQPNLTFVDIIYFLTTTAVTVGYGDISPKTEIGKIITIFYMIFGIVSMGFLFSAFTSRIQRISEKKRKGNIMEKNVELLIIGYPSEQKVKDLVEQLRVDPDFGNKKIVLISNKIEEKPEFFFKKNISFKKGVASDRQVLEDIDIRNVKTALILAENPFDISSDDVSSSALVAIETLAPMVKTIVEKVREDDLLFIASKADVITKVANSNLLAQEILEEGSIEFERYIFNNNTAGTQSNIVIEKDILWEELAIQMILNNKIPEGFKNPGESFNFSPKTKDLIKKGALIKFRS